LRRHTLARAKASACNLPNAGRERALAEGMKRAQNEKRWNGIAALLVVAAAEALAQENKSDRRIVVSFPDRKLALVEGERVVKVYDIAVGKASTPSPAGEFQIVNHIAGPTWYGPGKVVGPGADNPVGTRWMGLSVKGYGIHGTNAPGSIGKAASHGCIRMRNRDVEELFELVGVGATVELHQERPDIFTQILAEQKPPQNVPQNPKGE
jgi:lipoprotein-anchoring transpeptidase ErfK/SrfK